MEIKERVARAIRHGRRANQTATIITDAVLRALAEAGPTDGMVEKAKAALLERYEADHTNGDISPVSWAHLQSKLDSDVRAALQAALGVKNG